MYPRSKAGITLVLIGTFALMYALATGASARASRGAGSVPETTGLPTILVFAAAPTIVAPGSGSTLSWQVEDANEVRIEPELGIRQSSGSALVYPSVSTIYTLYATNSAGTRSAPVQVTVQSSYPGPGGELPTITFFSASPTSVGPGSSTTLSWSTTGATTLVLEPGYGVRPSSGSLVVYPATTTTFVLSAANGAGTVSKSLLVTVQSSYPGPGSPPEVVTFSATPSTIEPGGQCTLTWTTRGSASASIDRGVGGVSTSGSVVVSPATTTLYTLTATNLSGTSSSSVQVRVESGPPANRLAIGSFTATPSTISAGGGSVLAWTTSNATSVSIDPSIGGVTATGTRIVAPLATTKYTLTAVNLSEQARAEVLVSVNDGSCTTQDDRVCLNSSRFRVQVSWKDFEGKEGVGHAQQLTRDTGQFWFFNPDNVELVIKVLDGRAINGKFWVFYGALSNVEYTISVTDTETGKVRSYFNPSGQFASVGDTSAF